MATSLLLIVTDTSDLSVMITGPTQRPPLSADNLVSILGRTEKTHFLELFPQSSLWTMFSAPPLIMSYRIANIRTKLPRIAGKMRGQGCLVITIRFCLNFFKLNTFIIKSQDLFHIDRYISEYSYWNSIIFCPFFHDFYNVVHLEK